MKALYERPVLVEVGSFAELTRGYKPGTRDHRGWRGRRHCYRRCVRWRWYCY